MARYRKIDPRIWNDAKFRVLSNNGKLAFLFVLTHPHMTALGAMRATVPGLAAEIGWKIEAFREAFREALSKGMAKHDEEASFLWLPNFLRYNTPESPNVVKAWVDSLDLLPECQLKAELLQHVKAFAEGMTEGFAKALPEAFAKAMPYQEQEQEQEQEQNQHGALVLSLNGQPRPEVRRKPSDDIEALPGVDVDAWRLWLDYRKASKKPILAISQPAAMRKFIALGDQQMAAVEHSMANSYQGLVAPRNAGPNNQTKKEAGSDLPTFNFGRA